MGFIFLDIPFLLEPLNLHLPFNRRHRPGGDPPSAFNFPRGMIALSTVISDALVDEIIEHATAACADVAADAP
jgi:hypothetical protein